MTVDEIEAMVRYSLNDGLHPDVDDEFDIRAAAQEIASAGVHEAVEWWDCVYRHRRAGRGWIPVRMILSGFEVDRVTVAAAKAGMTVPEWCHRVVLAAC